MKNYFILLSLLLMLSISFAQVLDIYFFYGETCPHCSKVKPVLDEMEQKYGEDIAVHRYEIYNSEENRALFKEFLNEYGESSSGVPALFVADEFLVGSKQIPDNLENIIIENINSEATETVVPSEDIVNLNEIKESDDSMLGFWGIIQSPFVLLIIVIILIIIVYEIYTITSKKPMKKTNATSVKTRKSTKKRTTKRKIVKKKTRAKKSKKK